MKNHPSILCALVLLATPAVRGADTVNELFQKALVEEEANRNLEAAVRAYNEVVKRLDDQRHLAATAVFRLGECNRKLGQTNEAIASYERVLREFAGEEMLVKLSQQNLAALGFKPKTVTGVVSDPAISGLIPGSSRTGEASPAIADRLADLEEKILQSEELLKRWEGADPESLPGLLIASAGPTPELQALVGKRDDVRTQLVTLSADRGPETGPVKGLARTADILDKQIREKARTVIDSRRMQLEIDQKLAERLRARLASRDSGLAWPGTDSSATDHRQLAAQLAEIEKLPAGSDDRANAVLAFFPDDVLKRLLLHLPKLVQQRDEMKAEPTANRSVTYLPIDADGPVAVPARADGQGGFHAEEAVRIQRDAISRREDFLLGIQRARLKVLDRIVAAQKAGSGPASPPLSSAAREAQKALLLEEIKLIEQQVAEAKKQVEVGALAPLEANRPQRELLAKQRELLVLDNGSIEDQRSLLVAELKLVDLEVQATQAMVQNGKASNDELVQVKRQALQLRRRLQELEDAPATTTTASKAATPDDEEGLKIQRLQTLFRNSPDLMNAPGTDSAGLTPLQSAAKKGELKVAEFLIRAGADVSLEGTVRYAPIHFAAENGHKAVVELLLKSGASVNATAGGARGRTPLHLAAGGGHRAVIQALLDAGADVNAMSGNSPGNTPLLAAIEAHQFGVVKMLLDAKADPNFGPASQGSPLNQAIRLENTELISILLKYGASADGRPNQTPPLSFAVSRENVEAVQLLLEAGAKSDVVVDQSTDPIPLLVSAAKLGNQRIVQMLLARGANPNLPDNRGCTPLMFAIDPEVTSLDPPPGQPRRIRSADGPRPYNPAITRLLIEAKADPNRKNRAGRSALNVALAAKNSVAASQLLDAGADPNEILPWGETPLHSAVGIGKELTAALLKHKANPNLRGDRPATPLDYVRNLLAGPDNRENQPSKEELQEIAALLKQHGAKEDLPDPNSITLRWGAQQSFALRRDSEADWNRFTLVELIAMQAGVIDASIADSSRGRFAFPGRVGQQNLPFADWKGVKLRRASADGLTWRNIPVDTQRLMVAGECVADVPLEWGDVVEIPQRDHPLDAVDNFPVGAPGTWLNCVRRRVELRIKGESHDMDLAPEFALSESTRALKNPFKGFYPRLGPTLSRSGYVLTSSDLSRVRVRHLDGSTTREALFDLVSGRQASNVWLRDGDVIEIPDK